MLSDFPRKGHTVSGTVRTQSWSCPYVTLPVSNTLQDEYDFSRFFIDEESETCVSKKSVRNVKTGASTLQNFPSLLRVHYHITIHSSVDEKCLNAT